LWERCGGGVGFLLQAFVPVPTGDWNTFSFILLLFDEEVFSFISPGNLSSFAASEARGRRGLVFHFFM
jgi:hypothetical protein